MDMPVPQSLCTRVREYLTELAFDLIALHHRLFDPFDPKCMPDYRKELDPNFKNEDASHKRQSPRQTQLLP